MKLHYNPFRPRVHSSGVWKNGTITGRQTTIKLVRPDGSVLTRSTTDPVEELAIIAELKALGERDLNEKIDADAALIDGLPADAEIPLVVATRYLGFTCPSNMRGSRLEVLGLTLHDKKGRVRAKVVQAGELRAVKARGQAAPEPPPVVTETPPVVSDSELHARLTAIEQKLDTLLARGTPPLDLRFWGDKQTQLPLVV